MKATHYIVIVLVFFNLEITNAAIEGTIIDKQTNGPVYLANIFLANTTIGTTSNQEGHFSIDKCPAGEYELIVHHIAYSMQTFRVRCTGNETHTFNVKLTPHVIMGQEISVETTEPKEWKKQIKRFTKLFLGGSGNASQSEIINPEVIDLEYDSDKGILYASSDRFIQIKNHALGYDIQALLQNFKWRDSHDQFKRHSDTLSSYFTTQLLFTEMPATDQKQMEKWQKMRKKTYTGSFRHFLAAAAQKKLEFENFQLLKDGYKLGPEYITIKPSEYDDLLNLYFKGTINVLYTKIRPLRSTYLKMTVDSVQIDSLGNLYTSSPSVFIKVGKWQNERVADWMPLDYAP